MLLKTPHSFKKRLFINLMISSLIPLILIGYISYISIFSLLNNNVENGIQNNLKQIRISLGNAFNNLESSSLQLALDNNQISNKIDEYLKTDNLMNKYYLQKDIIDSIAVLNAVKPDLGTIFFYLAGKNEIIFKNQGIDSGFNLKNLPIISEDINFRLSGPHKSANFNTNNLVFSIDRKVYFINDADLHVFIETNFKHFEDLLSSQQYDLAVSHVLINSLGEVVYSQLNDDFPVGTLIDKSKLSDKIKTEAIKNDYYVFAEKGQHDWYVLAAISKKDYNYVINKWVVNFALFAFLSILCSALLAYSTWKIVYRPLKRLNGEISLMAQSQFDSAVKKTGINEFDNVLGRFQDMKSKIVALFKEIEDKERKKREIEVENLLHQINPHFLHNTLNTIQWLAKMNGQDEIDRLVALFARVLHYNLGKEGGIVSLNEEIGVLKDYIELHKFRYDNQFDIEMDIEADLMDVKIPRFIMQPIVENALYHGLKYDNGSIKVTVTDNNGYLWITVRDNGVGMSEEDIKALTAEKPDEHKRGGMGIGLSYVKRILDVYYGDEAVLNVKSEVGKGTTFLIQLPIDK